MSEANPMEELANIVEHARIWPGDTISHAGANECIRRGWAYRTATGDIAATLEGIRVLALAESEPEEPRDAD